MARRNSNGEGTIYRRKDGRWEGAIYVRTTSGTRKRLRVYGSSRTEVHAKLTDAKARQQQGIAAPDRVWKLGDYLDYWLENIIKTYRRPTTYESYENKVRLYLKPGLGHYSLKHLTVPVLQSYLNGQLADGQSVRVVQMLREVLSSALTSAMRQELISRNAARLVQLPGRSSSIGSAWTLAEATHFLEATKHHWLYPAFVLLLFYGLRRGEVLGIRWEDVHFARSELHIEQQIYRANGVVAEGPLKTKASRRTLPLLGIAKEALLRQHASSGNLFSHLVFTAQKSDSPVAPQTFTRAFQRACKDAGLRIARAHDMRHTTATLLKNLGVPARDVQLILGHSNITTTQQIYQHDDMSTRRDALARLEQSFGHGGNADPIEGSALPSKLPSNAISSLNTNERRRPTDVFISINSWLGWRDSNPRMHGPKPCALPLGDTPIRTSVYHIASNFSSSEGARLMTNLRQKLKTLCPFENAGGKSCSCNMKLRAWESEAPPLFHFPAGIGGDNCYAAHADCGFKRFAVLLGQDGD